MEYKKIDTPFLREYYENEALEENRQEKMYRSDAHNSYWQNVRFNEIKDIFSSIDAGNVLEVGCAEGLYLTTFKELNRSARLTGLDIARNYLKKLRARDKEMQLVQGDANELPFKSCGPDVVLCSETLEHVVDPKKTFFELCRVSKRYIIISVPGHTPFYHVGKRLGIIRRESISDTFSAPGKGHINEIDVNCLKQYLSEGNIRHRIIHQKTYCYFPPGVTKKLRIPLRLVELMDSMISKIPFLNTTGLVQVLAIEKI